MGYSSKNQRILSVQAGESIALLLRPQLDGIQIFTTTTAAAALLQARDQVFDLYVIADGLSDMDCAELCSRVRAVDPHTPIVIYSKSVPITAGFVAAVGAQACIADPLDPFSASALIRHLLRVARGRSLDARAAEHAAIVQHLSDRMRDCAKRLEQRIAASELLMYDAILMGRAYDAFSGAGGASADFKRMWPDAFKKAHDSASWR